MNDICIWNNSIHIYAIHTIIFSIYVASFMYKWISSKPFLHIKHISFWKTIMELTKIIFIILIGTTLDTLSASVLDSMFVGVRCALFHYGEIMNFIIRCMSIILFIGWKLVFLAILWEKHQIMFDCIGHHYDNVNN